MKVERGVSIICDGSYRDADGKLVPCGEELHPQTHAIVNKVGIMGHHCAWCQDPAATAAMAEALGYSQEELRSRYKSMEAARMDLDEKKAEADKAAAAADAQDEAAKDVDEGQDGDPEAVPAAAATAPKKKNGAPKSGAAAPGNWP